MNRRRFLTVSAAAAASLYTGCLQHPGRSYSFILEPVPDAVEHVTVAVEPWHDVAGAPDEDVVVHGERWFDDGSYVDLSTGFYSVEVEQTGEREMERQVLAAQEVEETEEAVDVDSYSLEYDRKRVDVACHGAVEDRLPPAGDTPSQLVIRRPPEHTELLPEPLYPVVRRRDSDCRLEVETRDVEEPEYTHGFTEVAEDREGFLEHVEARYVIDLDAADLSDDEREVLEQAKDEGYTMQGEAPEPFRSLRNRLDLQSEHRLLMYEGDLYSYRVD